MAGSSRSSRLITATREAVSSWVSATSLTRLRSHPARTRRSRARSTMLISMTPR
ncbi:hypothetical protein [Actinophytocola algeriensis]|uniref:Uncharacterized protein n=1 Tax=Actinophytocola algeriensis TaxID=1768010 RepID=A0A7W7Q198_9PSEU|nr:hypothetical protein [Actinophytocola algeriensis]MBB4905003.1 hypothetical protein [Actinophytocola algeriensis]MBE1476137.1 hypothetical protein [Actinophytocola algeriensis]